MYLKKKLPRHIWHTVATKFEVRQKEVRQVRQKLEPKSGNYFSHCLTYCGVLTNILGVG